ncbi:MAG: phosphoribosylanthranilate isomerase [Proteobacteria bacterium]|nr:phosphoribosylanthranilate isomerase [Pseudomonadota bacterium]
MNKIKVKFCGMRSLTDTKNAINAGCDAIGFVFVKKSKRYIDAHTVHKIINELKLGSKVTTVALFADHSIDQVNETLQIVDIDVLQFHGQESAKFCGSFDKPYWKAIPMLTESDYLAYMANYPDADLFLLDNYATGKMGGSGHSFKWFNFPQDKKSKMILAGGLNIENIELALRTTNTHYVDLSSGIESSAGVKSAKKMRQLIKKIKHYAN